MKNGRHSGPGLVTSILLAGLIALGAGYGIAGLVLDPAGAGTDGGGGAEAAVAPLDQKPHRTRTARLTGRETGGEGTGHDEAATLDRRDIAGVRNRAVLQLSGLAEKLADTPVRLSPGAAIFIASATFAAPPPSWSHPDDTPAPSVTPAFTGLDVTPAKVKGRGEHKFFGGLTEREFRTREVRCLATAIYHEARGESLKGQLAVAQTIMNRVRSGFFPDTVCGVVYQGSRHKTGCQFSFACDSIPDTPKDERLWRVARDLATRVAAGRVWLPDIGYASHYHATYVRPKWRKYMHKIKRIGIHIFYRAKFLPVPVEVAAKAG